MTPAPTHAWVFRARCQRVVDGDTLDLLIDQGMHAQRTERVRLLGVDCPEVHGPTREAGQAALLATIDWLGRADGVVAPPWPLVVQTAKDPDHFGRWLATVWRSRDGACLNDDLVASGHAVPLVTP